MAWVRIDDRAWSHPKLMGLTGNSFKVWVSALCWCNQQETDGAVSASMLRALGGSEKNAEELIKVGLWERTEQGFQVHDYLDYQPSRAELAASRDIAKRRATLRADPQFMSRLKARDLDLCRYCGRGVNWSDRRGPIGGTYDHVVPISAGGSDDFTNIVIACRECNSAKCGRTPEQWGRQLLPVGTRNTTGNFLVTRPDPDPDPDPNPDQNPPVSPPVGDRTQPSSQKRRKTSGTPAPESLEPNAATLRCAQEMGLDPVREIAACLDFHRGKGSIQVDWQATARTWFRNTLKFAGKNQPKPPGLDQLEQDRAAEAARKTRLFLTGGGNRR
jgi:hypothetical protein